eukprot:CAMPEP_0206471788 /NCGR_PEP_ID=MMETSP0324_2-20121206/31785_1 /ASSEMBLY_ACC=CAM_ASM_000836 /TAXON_ID=2866 /ORGANISM="Crypthecodinium cohnii, Strain Seligo" /LENGTH=141 /DNA_ID=CAMNT_0053946207 /DNA_START=133 /DNA_END=558 /DNA_ORIENTATION=-
MALGGGLYRPQSFGGAAAPAQVAVRCFSVPPEAPPEIVVKAQQMIEDNPCMVFSKTTCPFCSMAKTILLGELKAKVEIFEVDKEVHWKQLNALGKFLEDTTGARTFPRVFIQGKCVGGGDDVADLFESGKLRGMLEKAGAL